MTRAYLDRVAAGHIDDRLRLIRARICRCRSHRPTRWLPQAEDAARIAERQPDRRWAAHWCDVAQALLDDHFRAMAGRGDTGIGLRWQRGFT